MSFDVEAALLHRVAYQGGDSPDNPAYSVPDTEYDARNPNDLPNAIAKTKNPRVKAALQDEFTKRQAQPFDVEAALQNQDTGPAFDPGAALHSAFDVDAALKQGPSVSTQLIGGTAAAADFIAPVGTALGGVSAMGTLVNNLAAKLVGQGVDWDVARERASNQIEKFSKWNPSDIAKKLGIDEAQGPGY